MINLLRPSALCIFFLFVLIPCVNTSAQVRTARVIAENANLRQMPRDSGLAEIEVPEGMLVKILDEKSPWYVVRVGDRVGWMHRATLLFLDTATPTSEREPVRATTSIEIDSVPRPTKSTADRIYIRGPRGGCYYISGSGRKVYVDRSMCN